jgi:hypothetical protein
MTPTASAALVAQLFAAAGRQYGETELVVYAKALHLVPDDVGQVVVDELVREVSWDNPPSTGMVVKHAQAVLRRRREAVSGIPETTGEPVSREESLEWVKRIREEHGPSPLTEALEGVAMRQPATDA